MFAMRSCHMAALLLLCLAEQAAALKTQPPLTYDYVGLEALVAEDLQVYYQGRADSDSDHRGGVDKATVTLSPQQRAQQHSFQFEKEFTVELDMTEAHDKGLAVGIILDYDTDWEPVSILTIRKTGLLEAWNKEHPDRAVLVGDEIMKVNDILWHHNTNTFAERIKGQFVASRKQVPGSKNILSLSIQRPRKERRTRFKSQREDLHNKLYSREFVAEVPFTGVLPSESLHQAMGWKLNSTVDWAPVSIEKLRGSGLVENYNREHPETTIQAGDEILQVNAIKWHHNAKTFEDRINAQFLAGKRSELTNDGTRNVLELYIRRPRSARSAPASQVYTRQFLVELHLMDASPLGWYLNATGDEDPLAVVEVHRDSPLSRFNEANPDRAVRPGDVVMKVNDALWHRNSQKFLERIDKEFERVRPRENQIAPDQPLMLTMQRRLVQPILNEWSVTLPAAEDKVLGWHLTSESDEFPLTVDKVRSVGLVAEWNQNHFMMANNIQSGDVIVKVNDQLWHQDSTEFQKRVNEQYSKSKKWGNITFFFRRPVAAEGGDDADRPEARPFQREFLVELSLAGGKWLGWQLQCDNASAPVTVAKIRSAGAVGAWNEANPLLNIQVGDRLTRVNSVLWHGNSTVFMDRLNAQVNAARTGKAKPNITVLVQRPSFKMTGGDSSTEDADSDEVGSEDGDEVGSED